MSTIKSIYNSTSLECALELLWLTLGVRLDLDFVSCQLVNVDATQAKLVITALPQAADGRIGIYSGTAEFVYDKMDIRDILPTDLVYGDAYPVSFERLRTYLANSYDYLLEENEFIQDADGTQNPLAAGDLIGLPPDTNGDVFLRTSSASGRWKGGNRIRIHLTSAVEDDLPSLAFANDAVDGTVGDSYYFVYQGSGGKAPYRFEILSGSPIANWDEGLQRFTGTITAPGMKSWTVRMFDARGYFIDMVDSANGVVAPLTLIGAAADGTAATPLSCQYTAHGGVPPYTYTKVGVWARDASVSDSGLMTGTYDAGAVTQTLRVTDSYGNSTDLTDNFNIAPRTTLQVADSLYNKLLSWYAMDDGEGYLANSTVKDLHGAAALTLNGQAASILGPVVGALQLTGAAAVGPLAAHHLSNDMAFWFNARGAGGQLGRYLLNRMAPAAGWAVHTDTTTGKSLGFETYIGGTPVYIQSTSDFFDGSWHQGFVQRAGGYVDIALDNSVPESFTIPAGVIDDQDTYPTTLGARADGMAGTSLNADFDTLAIFDARLWSDERAYLYNGGTALTYYQLLVDAGRTVVNPALQITGVPGNGNVGVAYSATMTITGGDNVYANLRLVAGALPDGVTMSMGGFNLQLTGSPTTAGSYSAGIALDSGDKQTALLLVTIVIDP